MSVAPDSGGEGVAGGGGFHVNPYHQAWAAQAEQRPGLSLVEEAGVAHIVMGGNNVVDMFDFQINQKQFPPAFFKKDPKTGIQRRFTCLVCNVSLFDENLVRTHCFSQVTDFIYLQYTENCHLPCSGALQQITRPEGPEPGQHQEAECGQEEAAGRARGV